MKKLISILLAVLMIISSVTAFAFASDTDRDIPIVCVHGYGANIYYPDGSVVYPPESNYDIGEHVKKGYARYPERARKKSADRQLGRLLRFAL